MVNPHWRKELEREFSRENLPKSYSERLMDELLDHYANLNEERTSMDAQQIENAEQRIGAPEQIAHAAATEFRNRSLIGRHPLLTFVVAPIPLWILVAGLCLALMMLVGWLIKLSGVEMLGWTTSTVSPAAVWVFQALFSLWMLAPFVASASIAVWIAKRYGRSRMWALVSCLMIAVLGGLFHSHLILPVEPGSGQLSFGFGFPVWNTPSPTTNPEAISFTTRHSLISQLMLCMMPIAIGVYSLWSSRRMATMDG